MIMQITAVRVLLIVTLGAVLAACGGQTQATSSSGKAQVGAIGQTTVTFASEPDPPKSGDNGFVVTIKNADGTPVADAKVIAVFSMPPMPSMNMPAMRSDATLASQGGGVYRGSGQLSMAGTWNVTVSVSRAGTELGSAKFSIVAK
jgi:hypothetical protein